MQRREEVQLRHVRHAFDKLKPASVQHMYSPTHRHTDTQTHARTHEHTHEHTHARAHEYSSMIHRFRGLESLTNCSKISMVQELVDVCVRSMNACVLLQIMLHEKQSAALNLSRPKALKRVHQA